MQDQRLSIYNASAGSGKTYQIAKNFLIHILKNPSSFYTSHLIGLTFTNKAANEMKRRILSILMEASKGQMDPLMEDVMREIKPDITKQLNKELDEKEHFKEIQKRSKHRLKEILHNYDDFNLLTIDKLSYKIIRTFSREMEIPYDVNIVINPDEIIDNLIDEIISELKPGDPLMKNLTDLALENVEDEKIWDIKNNFEPIKKLIANENYRKEIEYIKTKSSQDIIGLKNKLIKKVNEFKKQYIDLGKKGRLIIDDSPHQFGVKGLIDNFVNPGKHNKISFSDKLLDKLSENKLISESSLKKKPLDEQEKIRMAEQRLLPILQEVFTLYSQNFELYMLYKGILENINSLIILHELVAKVDEFKEYTHSLFISDFNPLIQKQIIQHIADETPYIYLRLGEKYIHYFLDEFQDTSELQWLNMIPLIKEALSKDFARMIDEENPGTTMIVGDAKQSIYRFRNGKPELFIDLSNEELKKDNGNPFYPITKKKVNHLKENWRSDGQIIQFNNAFFSIHKDKLTHEKYRRVYEHVKQVVPEKRKTVKEKGYIEIHFEESLSDKNEDFSFPQKMEQIIKKALERGYQYEDICFLYDANRSSEPVAEYFSKQGIPFMAEKSLKLGNSHKVNALMNFIKYLSLHKSEPLFDALEFLFDYHQLPEKDLLLSTAMQDTHPDHIFELLNQQGFSIQASLLYGLNLFDLVVYLIDKLHLNRDNKEENYLQTFLDDIYQFTKENKTGIIGYIMHWNTMKDKIDIKGAEKKGAVQFMTVHSSKGLEFPIVVYLGKGSLFDKRKENEHIVWIDTDKELFEGFEKLPVKLGVLENIENYRDKYKEVESEKIFDNYNRLYVAHTRTENELYIFTEKPAKKPNSIPFKNMYSEFIKETKNFAQINSGEIYSFGEPTFKKHKKKKTESIIGGQTLGFQFWNDPEKGLNLKIRNKRFEYWQEAKKSAIEYGLQLHEIMAKIKTFSDWQQNKEKYLATIPEKDKHKIEEQIEKIIMHPQLNLYFSPSYHIFNERAILIPSDKKAFTLRRPDRILIKEKKAVIIDYKTGEKLKKHIYQINEYGELMEEMGYQIEDKILLYLGKEMEIVRV